MEITLNDVKKQIAIESSLAVLANIEIGEHQNGVPRLEWETYFLKQNDNILIIKATQGG